MKSNSTFLLLFFIPFLVASQGTGNGPRNPLSIPYLFSEYNKQVKPEMLQLYKIQSSLTSHMQAASRTLLPVVQALDSIIITPVDSTLLTRKSAFEYNNDGLITSKMNYYWDTLNKSWVNVNRETWSYNTNRNVLIYTSYYGDELNWYNEIRNEFNYDANNRLMRIDGYGWNESDNKWDLGSKVDYTYNGEDQVVTTIFSEWDGSQWNPYSKFDYEYNFSGEVVVTIEQEWQGQWVNKNKGEFDYYIFGKERNFYFDVWDGFTTWVKFSRSEALYNPDRNIDIVREYLWDLISVLYVDFRKTEYRYNIDLNMNQSIHSIWVKREQDFILEAKEDCIYNTQYSHGELLLPPNLKFSQSNNRLPDNDIYFQDMLTNYSYFLHDGSKYILTGKDTFYYSPRTITKSNTANNTEISIQPNPAIDYINIISNRIADPTRFILFDLNGKEKINQVLDNGIKVSTQFLSPGLYVYKLLDKNGVYHSGKLVRI